MLARRPCLQSCIDAADQPQHGRRRPWPGAQPVCRQGSSLATDNWMTPPTIVSLPHPPAALDRSIVGKSIFIKKLTGSPHFPLPNTAQAWCSRPRRKACCAA